MVAKEIEEVYLTSPILKEIGARVSASYTSKYGKLPTKIEQIESGNKYMVYAYEDEFVPTIKKIANKVFLKEKKRMEWNMIKVAELRAKHYPKAVAKKKRARIKKYVKVDKK